MRIAAGFFIAVAGIVGLLGVNQPARTPAVRILFIGNSLTASNDLPAMLQAIAKSRNIPLEIETCTPGGFSLEDHWNRGDCRKTLERSKFDFVVLQQGPSSRPENATNLKLWSINWGDAIRARGATPALYMVWPYRGQRDGFRDVSNAYRSAADAAKGTLLAAGDAWRNVEAQNRGPALYTEDGLHPTVEGSYLAALVIARELLDADPGEAPAKLKLASGRSITIKPDVVAVLRDAASRVATPTTRPR